MSNKSDMHTLTQLGYAKFKCKLMATIMQFFDIFTSAFAHNIGQY